MSLSAIFKAALSKFNTRLGPQEFDLASVLDEMHSAAGQVRISANSGLVINAGSGGISASRFLDADGSGGVVHAARNSLGVMGVSTAAAGEGQRADLVVGGICDVLADTALLAGQHVKSAHLGKACELVDSTNSGDTIKTGVVGTAFTNQPSNDGVEIVSDSASDGATKSAVVYGTTTGTDTLVSETVALNGVSAVSTIKTDWGVILGVKLVATSGGAPATATGTVTFREASGNAAITTITAGNSSKGIATVTGNASRAFNVAPAVVAEDTTTKQIGLIGTDHAGNELLDSQALSGATPQTMNSAFRTVTEVLLGDVEATRTPIVKVGAEDDEHLSRGIVLVAAAAGANAKIVYANA